VHVSGFGATRVAAAFGTEFAQLSSKIKRKRKISTSARAIHTVHKSLMDKIRVLLDSTDRFEQSSIPILENFIVSQIKETQFNLEVSLALVKLYQFFPTRLNYDVLVPLLAQLLANTQEQAFTTALFMIPDSIVCPFASLNPGLHLATK
jgi:hypothetical protein